MTHRGPFQPLPCCDSVTQISSPSSAESHQIQPMHLPGLRLLQDQPILRAQKITTIKQLRKRSNPANPTKLPLGAALELLRIEQGQGPPPLP